MVYLVIWWTMLFAVLPLGVEGSKIRAGQEHGRRSGRSCPQGDHHHDRGGRTVARLLRPAPGGFLQLPRISP
jgi:predicted secreted protein